MKVFFWIVYLIFPITFFLFIPISKFAIKIGINGTLGFRTSKSMSNEKNWKKSHYLMGKYSLILGIFSLIQSLIWGLSNIFTMEITSLILTFINIVLMFLLCVVINLKI